MAFISISFTLEFLIAVIYLSRYHHVQLKKIIILVVTILASGLVSYIFYRIQIFSYSWIFYYPFTEYSPELTLISQIKFILTIVISALIACIYAYVLLRVKSVWKLSATIPGAALLVAIFLLITVQIANIALDVHLGQRSNLSITGTADSMVLKRIWAPSGINIKSKFIDLLHTSQKIDVKADDIRVYGGKGIVLDSFAQGKNIGINLKFRKEESIFIPLHGKIPSNIPNLWNIKTSKNSLYTINSIKIGAPGPVLKAFSAETINRPSTEHYNFRAHSLILFERDVSASLIPGGLKSETISLSMEEVEELRNSPVLNVTFKNNPIWGFGSEWFGSDETQARRLLPHGEKAIFLKPALGQGLSMDNPLRKEIHYGGEFNIRPKRPIKALLMITESIVKDSKGNKEVGTLIFVLNGVSSIRAKTVPLAPNEGYFSSGAAWSLLAKSIEQEVDFLVSYFESGNTRGSLNIGMNSRELTAYPNTLTILGHHQGLRVAFQPDVFSVRAAAGLWREATLNGESLWPSWWGNISKDARATILGTLAVFLLGIWFTKQQHILVGLRWTVFGPDLRQTQCVNILLVSGERIKATSWRFARDHFIGEKACFIDMGQRLSKGSWTDIKDAVVPVSQILTVQFEPNDGSVTDKS